MSREPLQDYEDRPEGAHTRGARARGIEARRRNTVVAAMVAAIVLVVVLVLVL